MVTARPHFMALCLLALLCCGGWSTPARGASSASAPPKSAVGPEQDAKAKVYADRPELLSDAPPPTLWDRRHEEGGINGTSPEKVGDNQSMLAQLVRTLVALCGVLFLLWAFARVIGPRVARSLGNKRSLGMQVTDRLSLDGRNTLVRVRLSQGQSYLIACGDHHAQLIDKLPADAPNTSTPSQPFAERMGAPKVPEE